MSKTMKLAIYRVAMLLTLYGTRVLAADGGIDFSDLLYSTCPVAPPSVTLDGGSVLLPPARAARVACIMETCESDRQWRKVERDQQAPPGWWVATSSAAVVGIIAGTLLGRYIFPAPPTSP